MANLNENVDQRARLTAKGAPSSKGFERVFGKNEESNILFPLHKTRGILFPYTPVLTWQGNVTYEEYHMTHTNYRYNAFAKSAPGPFNLDAMFTAQTEEEAQYMLAVMHWLKTSTKMYFGRNAGRWAGVPPPVLTFSYLGAHMFNRVPVIIKSYQYVLDNTVDYVPVRFKDKPELDTFVPVQMNINMELDIQMNTKTLRDQFDLSDFTDGSFLDGRNGSFGGWV